MSWARRGLSPVKTTLVGIVVLAVASYFIFTKQWPFTHHYTITAVVRTSNLLTPGSPVRIGGDPVGQVLSTGRYRHTNLGEVTMRIDSGGQPIHRDATIRIRPRLFLEGNFYVQLSPGTPGSPALPDGGTIPLAQTTTPVQIDQVLDAFPADIRSRLQQALQGLGQAFDTKPSPSDNARLDPAVRGLTGAQAINKTFDTSVASLRDSAQVSQAMTGPQGNSLAQVIAGFGRASEGLARADGRLSALISEFDQTMRATAAQQQPLRRVVALLGPTAKNASTAFSALSRSFPASDRFARALAASLPQVDPTISAADPWLDQAKPLFSKAELQGLLSDLAPASAQLAHLTNAELQFLPRIDAFDRCMTDVFLPTGNLVLKDGALSSGVPNYWEFWYAMTGQAAEAQGADGNGNFLRIAAPGGSYPVQTGQTNLYGKIDTGFALMPAPPLRTRPSYPNQVPPLQRRVPCYTQPLPEVNGPAATGPADGSHPNSPPPPVPNDPALRIPRGG